MGPGDIVADQFQLLNVAGRGGMGVVYRAIDQLSGMPVAFKVLSAGNEAEEPRFLREARALAELNHPGIVRYIAHGRAPSGDVYLVMEWVDGKSVTQRLRTDGFTMSESVTLAIRLAETLSAAHRRGVIHRDLKPSNILLPSGNVERAKILDFGIAHLATDSLKLTRTGMVVGTPGYMAPEQARAEPNIDARVDLFALGCVLFNCLTGEQPFKGTDMVAVMLKVVLEDAPRARSIRADIPEELDEIVAKLLAKKREDRPSDAASAVAMLRALGPLEGGTIDTSAIAAPSLTAVEKRLHCMVLARPIFEASTGTTINAPDDLGDLMFEETADADSAALTRPFVALTIPRTTEIAARFGGRVEVIADGSIVVTLASSGAPTDQAAQAARCALALRAALGGAPMALVSGRTVASERSTVGEVIERGVGLLNQAGSVIYVDEITAGLLGSRFDLGGERGGLTLLGERTAGGEPSRTLLGRATPCVGRDRELAALSGFFEECTSEPMARAVLITGAAGIGKSRLRYEFLTSLRARSQRAEIWVARGDPISAGSPFGMIAQPIRRAAGVLDSEPLWVSQQKLRARVSRSLSGRDLARVTEFLGELSGVPFPDDQSVELRAARHDPMVMGDQMRRAFEDWLGAECQLEPLILVLEDLHYGDLPSVRFLDAALRNLASSPILVLAVARPEVHDLFPKLWVERNVQEIRLGELTKKPMERLVREVLGAFVSEEVLAAMVARAAGNAFYLEELIRAVAQGKGAELPQTVLAMVQARLDGLEGEARRVLRAASVFGQVFWRGGVMALLGGEQQTLLRGDWLEVLVSQEMVSVRSSSKFKGDQEYIFRNALVREAAYGMLTDDDRVLGHRLAGRWLEAAGERDPSVLAEHFERGAEPKSAGRCYRRAAAQALEGNDLLAALQLVSRGFACGAEGEELGSAKLIAAEAHRYRGEFFEAASRAIEAVQHLPFGGALWHKAVGEAALAGGRLGKPERILPLVEALLDQRVVGEMEASDAHIIASAQTAGVLLFMGRHDLAGSLLEHIRAIEAAGPRRGPEVLAWIDRARATRLLFSGDPGACLGYMESSSLCFEHAGDLRSACTQRVNVGYAYMQVGAYGEAERALRESLRAAERMGLSMVMASAMHNLGLSLARQGRLEEGITAEWQALQAAVAQGDRRLEGGARTYLSSMLAQSGDLDRAAQQARFAVDASAASPPARAYALATLAHVLFLQGKTEEAGARANEAAALLDAMEGAMEEGEALVRLVHAESLVFAGQGREAQRAILAARERLLARAARISDPTWRSSFLERVPENARTLLRAREWLGVT